MWRTWVNPINCHKIYNKFYLSVQILKKKYNDYKILQFNEIWKYHIPRKKSTLSTPALCHPSISLQPVFSSGGIRLLFLPQSFSAIVEPPSSASSTSSLLTLVSLVMTSPTWKQHQNNLEWVSEWICCLTSQLTIFQSYMWRHIDVQADWRRNWTYGRAPNAIDIS